jgi:hypothetical protein
MTDRLLALGCSKKKQYSLSLSLRRDVCNAVAAAGFAGRLTLLMSSVFGGTPTDPCPVHWQCPQPGHRLVAASDRTRICNTRSQTLATLRWFAFAAAAAFAADSAAGCSLSSHRRRLRRPAAGGAARSPPQTHSARPRPFEPLPARQPAARGCIVWLHTRPVSPLLAAPSAKQSEAELVSLSSGIRC